MKRVLFSLVFLAAFAATLFGLHKCIGSVYAADKPDPQQYQVDVTIRFNSLSMAEFAEVQGVLDKLAKVSERLAAIEAALPDATKKVEATPAWAEYRAAAAVTDEKLKAVKELPEFKAYQRLLTERAYLQNFAEPKQ